MDIAKKYIKHFKAGDVIYEKGDLQTDFYIINKGKVQIKIEEDNIVLTTLTKGDFFGEESLNTDHIAAFTVYVIENSDIIEIPYVYLVDMMKKSTKIALKILKKLSEKNLKMLNNLLTTEKKIVIVDEQKDADEDTQDDATSKKIPPDIKAYLIIKRSNRMVQLIHKKIFLGRRDYTTGFIPDVDLTREDEEKYISRKHSSISYIDSKFYIAEEPGSVNGTYLNGEKLNTGIKYELKNEDELTLCHLNLKFKLG